MRWEVKWWRKKYVCGCLIDLYSITSYDVLFLFFSYVLERLEILTGTAPYSTKPGWYRIAYFHYHEDCYDGLHESREDGLIFLSMDIFKISRREWFRQCFKISFSGAMTEECCCKEQKQRGREGSEGIYMTNLVVQVFVVNRETHYESSRWKEVSN